ncbi:MAG: RluA family pseudouridine synthase [Holosporales bacterium]|nr:RluA family pseudouridine synthase [Holosporales bacterium]
MEIIKLKISDDYIGKRLDLLIAELSNRLSRSQSQKLIKSGRVLVDDVMVADPSKKIQTPCEVVIKDYESDYSDYEITAEDIPLDILFEDEQLVVVNKAAGMVCHPAPGHKSGTLVNAMAFHLKNESYNTRGDFRPGIVHRLDKDTSGVMVIAKNNETRNQLSNLFANEKGKLVTRKYTCFVFGVPFEKRGRIETFITRHPRLRQQFKTSETTGKKAATLYEVDKSAYFTSTKAISKINCELLTGRTHQIRVHMQHIGHCVVGDQVYGKRKIESSYPDIVKNFSRQALHSSELSFVHPISKNRLKFEAPLPEDLKQLESLF